MQSGGLLSARVEPVSLDRGYCLVDPEFARGLTSHHEQVFTAAPKETPFGPETITCEVPNQPAETLAHLDERGLAQIGTQVAPGTILVGMTAPGDATEPTPEEKLLQAIFGKSGGVTDVSIRAPAGATGTVQSAEIEDGDARVVVGWDRPLEVGDLLMLSGEPVLVSGIEPLGADVGWTGPHVTVSVEKKEIARDRLHARSIGPYQASTQQPVQEGPSLLGQVFSIGRAEILGAHAPWALWEMATLKSDCVDARMRTYEALVRGEAPDATPRRPRRTVSFFSTQEDEVQTEVPETTRILALYLAALGFEVRFAAQQIRPELLSRQAITSRTQGEVTEASTVSDDGKTAPDGLRCQKIFGPTEDYRCACGKYARMKHRGVVCEACGVEVASSAGRRQRTGRITLTAPCVHPAFITEVELLLGSGAVGADGAQLKEALETLDLDAIDATETGPRADLALALSDAGLRPESLLLEVILVPPPDLRDLKAGTDLDALYLGLLSENNRLRAQVEAGEPADRTGLQAALTALFERLSSATEQLWQSAQVKSVDFSAVAHVVVDPTLEAGWCRLPREAAAELFKPIACSILESRGRVTTFRGAKRLIEDGHEEAWRAIEEACEGAHLLLAAPEQLVVRKVLLGDAPAIGVDEATAKRLKTHVVQAHLPLLDEAKMQLEALTDEAWAPLGTAPGWLGRAAVEGSMVAAVRGALLEGQADDRLPPPIAALLGRTPPLVEAEDLAAWRAAEKARRQRLFERQEAARPEPTVPEIPEALQRSIDELEVSVATANLLARLGMRTMADLVQRTEAELLKTNGFGRKRLAEVKDRLADLGLSLGTRLR